MVPPVALPLSEAVTVTTVDPITVPAVATPEELIERAPVLFEAQVTKLLITVLSCALATSGVVLGPVLPLRLIETLAGERIIEVMVVEVTAKGIVTAVAPLWLTVTNVEPAPTASITQEEPGVASSFTTALLLLAHVEEPVTGLLGSELPFTSVALTING